MATTVTDESGLYEIKFTQIFELLAQQMEARIPMSFRQQNHMGSKAAQAIRQVGKTNPSQRVNRLEPVAFTQLVNDSRWAYPKAWDEYAAFDDWDQLQTEADPKGSWSQAIVAGMNRAQDAECIRAFFETSNTGEQGNYTTPYPAGNTIAVNYAASGNTGLTVAKLRQARRLLLQNEVDLDMGSLYCVAAATQLDDLLAEAQVINRDFNQPDAPVLEEGKITRFLGIRFIHSELLTQTVDPFWQVPVYHETGMHFGTWLGINTKIVQRYDLRMAPWQIGVSAAFGATRLQEAKVMQILAVPRA
jgi:hypothetical protein